MIDFSKLSITTEQNKVISPRDIFGGLTNKHSKYDYLRDVQSEVLDKWFFNRENKDNLIKMNTGSGKTVVGLLILQSCLNEKPGPTVYVVPDKYLVTQVLKEAANLGIKTTQNARSLDFQRGKSILVINIYELINGKSKFGVEEKKINIDNLLIDDAHACLDTTEDQFTLKIKKVKEKEKELDCYRELYELLKDDLKNYSEMKLLELEEGITSTYIQIPFWIWENKLTSIRKTLLKHRDEEDLKYKFPLIKNDIQYCNCVIDANNIEISPKFLPIDIIHSFNDAKKRIFMTATLSDDTILATHFGVNLKEKNILVTPNKSNDIGERMILAPQELNPDITDEKIKSYLTFLAEKYNVVVIVPSYERAKFWESATNSILHSETFSEGIKSLKNSSNGLTVLINRYNGIDLPKDDCRVLVIDGLPDVRRKIDKIKETALKGSFEVRDQIVQKIEQGMGRGIRSQNDYCTVLLLGEKLLSSLYAEDGITRLSSATKLQIQLSELLSKQLRGASLREIDKTIQLCLNRNDNWVNAHRQAIITGNYEEKLNVRNNIISELAAFNFSRNDDFTNCEKELQNKISETNDNHYKGWLKQELAFYTNKVDTIKAQEILKSSRKFNNQLMKPIEGIQYSKINLKNNTQAKNIINYIEENNLDMNNYILKINGILSDLIFKPETAEEFEEALKVIGNILGFSSQRPEKEYNEGPDNLWRASNNAFVIECKNGVIVESIGKNNSNQLSGSIEWFNRTYHEENIKMTPVLIIPYKYEERDAFLNKNSRIIDKESLSELKVNIVKFIKEISNPNNFKNEKNIFILLGKYKLTPSTILEKYSQSFKKKY